MFAKKSMKYGFIINTRSTRDEILGMGRVPNMNNQVIAPYLPLPIVHCPMIAFISHWQACGCFLLFMQNSTDTPPFLK